MDWQLFGVICMVLGMCIAILAYSESRREGGVLYADGNTAKDENPRQAA